MKRCLDCSSSLTGHGLPKRCRPCAARHRYILKNGQPPERIIANCGTCGKEFTDYASNRTKAKQGVRFCSAECRAAWVGVHNSISRGGDGRKRTKKEKDRIDYRKSAGRRRQTSAAYYRANRAEVLAKKREADRALKREVIMAYGGRCQCCGETHIEFLTIDHTDGSGAEHRKRCGKGRRLYADLKAQGFPKDRYQCLCFNCNISLGFYGYCPHRPELIRPMNKQAKRPGRRCVVA